jgi:hypothetical protein
MSTFSTRCSADAVQRRLGEHPAAGEPDLVAKALKGYAAGNKAFKVHLDGYNLIPFLKGEVKEFCGVITAH